MPSETNPGPVLQRWLRGVVARIWPGVIAIVLVTRVALVANLLVRPDDLAHTHARMLHGIGLAFSFAHLVVAPKMLKLERGMKNSNSTPEETIDLVARWLKVNNVRTVLVDVPFWAVTLRAALEASKN